MKLRRASPGHTHDLWPCCGRPPASAYGRPKEGVCSACAALMKAGQAAIDAISPELTPHWWTERAYAWPQWYPFEWAMSYEEHRELGLAFWALVSEVTQPAPASTPRDTGIIADGQEQVEEWRRARVPWPDLIDVPYSPSNRTEFRRLVLCSAPMRAALNALYMAIGLALQRGHAQAKSAGLSIVRGLASGEVSVRSFDDAVLEVKEPRRR